MLWREAKAVAGPCFGPCNHEEITMCCSWIHTESRDGVIQETSVEDPPVYDLNPLGTHRRAVSFVESIVSVDTLPASTERGRDRMK